MADQNTTTAPIMCNLSLADIIAQLHEKALEETKSKFSNFEIVNSAIEGKKGSYKLVGAGQHIVTAVAKEGSIAKAEAKPALQTYVQWFVGPDLKSDLKDDAIYALQTDQSAAKPDEKTDEKHTKDAKDIENASQDNQKNESISVISFSTYLNESMLISEQSDSDANDVSSGDDSTSSDTENDTSNDDSDGSADSSEQTDDTGSNKDSDEKQPAEQPDDEEKSRGWYVAYELDVEGAKKQSSIKDSIKFMAHGFKNVWKSLVEPISITFGSFSGTRSTKTIGDLDKALGDLGAGLAAIFGKIDASKLKAEFDKKLKAKLPQTTTTTEYFDKATLSKCIKKALKSADIAKVNSADYSLCVKVPHDDLSQKELGKSNIADMVTSSIQGMFKKFKNKVNPDDVILVNNLNNDHTTSDKVSLRKETKEFANSKKLLLEDSKKADDSMIQQLKDKLQELAESKLKDILISTTVDTSQNVISILEKANVVDNTLKSSLADSEYAFLIETEEDINSDKQNVNASNKNKASCLLRLFETALSQTKSIDVVRSIFDDLIVEFGDMLGNDATIKKTAINDLNAYVSDDEATKNESRRSILHYAELMFEQLFPDEISIISEKAPPKKKTWYKEHAKYNAKKQGSATSDVVDVEKDKTDSAQGDTSANEESPVEHVDNSSASGENDSKQGDSGNSAEKQMKKQHVFYAIPDENNLAFISDSNAADKNDSGHALSGEQTFIFGYKDPKDPKKFITIGKPSTVDSIDKLSYRDLPTDADGNTATKWDPSEDELQSDPEKYIGNPDYTRKDDEGNPQTKIIAVFGNTISQDSGKYDFYVIPMKGLKMSSE